MMRKKQQNQQRLWWRIRETEGKRAVTVSMTVQSTRLANKIVNAAGVGQKTAPQTRFHHTDMELPTSLRN